MLDPHRHADEVVADTCRGARGGIHIAMRRRRGMDHERLRVADIRRVRDELDAVDERLARLKTAFKAEPDDRAVAFTEIAVRVRVRGMRGKRRMVHPRYPGVRRKRFREETRV